MFINFSNHPAVHWGEKQKFEAEKYGEVVDYPFPTVDAFCGEERIREMAEQIAGDIIAQKPIAAMCSGEFTLTFAVIARLQQAGIRVFAACTERTVVESIDSAGQAVKTSKFEFVKFREYERIATSESNSQ